MSLSFHRAAQGCPETYLCSCMHRPAPSSARMSRRPPEPWGAAVLHDRPARARCGGARTAERLDPWRAGGGEAASAPAARAGVTASATRVGLCPSWRAPALAQARAPPLAGAVGEVPWGRLVAGRRGVACATRWWRRGGDGAGWRSGERDGRPAAGRVVARRAGGWRRGARAWQLSVSCVCGGWLSERHKCAGKDTLPCAEIWGTQQSCNVCRVSWFRAHGKLHLYRVPQAQYTVNICFFKTSTMSISNVVLQNLIE